MNSLSTLASFFTLSAILLVGLVFAATISPNPAQAASCDPTGPLMLMKPEPRQVYISKNPIQCKTLCWFQPCVIGSGADQMLQQIGQQLGQQLTQKIGDLLQKALQGGGGGGGGGGSQGGAAPAPPAPAWSPYDASTALDDITKQFDPNNQSLDNFFAPADKAKDDTTTTGPQTDTTKTTETETKKPGLAAQSYFCPNGVCPTTASKKDEDAEKEKDAKDEGDDTEPPKKTSTTHNNSNKGETKTYTQTNLPKDTEDPGFDYDPDAGTLKASKPAEAVAEKSLVDQVIEYITPGDSDRIVKEDVSEEQERESIRPWSPSDRYDQPADSDGSSFFGDDSDADGERPGSSAYEEAFNWRAVDEPEGMSDRILKAIVQRWLQITPFPIIIVSPFLFNE